MKKQTAKFTRPIYIFILLLLSMLANPLAARAKGMENLNGANPPWTITGNVGVAGVTLSYFDGTSQSVISDGSGNYSLTVSDGFTGSVTPSLAGYTFTPDHKDYTNVTADISGDNYTATPITFTISGNAGVAGATLSYTDGTAKTATADGTGAYSFPVSFGFTGPVTPSLAGYTFTPDHKDYTNVTADMGSEDYTATPITFTISGNAGVAGATLSYTDGTAKTATADGTGAYSFPVSFGFTGPVTPSLTGYTFSPTSKTYTNVQSNQTAENYTATAITFTISGNAGVAGATLSYTDGTAKTATADGTGAYSFPVSFGFTGPVTPSLTGYTFSPTSKTYTNVQANQTAQNYTATAITFTISGNAGVAGATLSYTDGTAKTATADGTGAYSFPVSFGFTGPVTPSLTGFIFSPTSKTYTNVQSNQTAQNYTAVAITFTISGNAGTPGATMSYTDGSLKTVTADGSGNYSLIVSYNWSGSVTPSKAGFTFLPVNTPYTNVLANATNQNYTATPITFTISGNAGVAGAVLSYTDGTLKTATADGSGNYTFTVSYSWSGTVTPSLAGFTFTPTNKTYTNVLANQTLQNYTVAGVTFSISGNAGVAGAVLSYTDVTLKSVTADGTGNYTLPVSYNWSGTVTPALAGYTFSPVNKPYTNVLANQTLQNYTATAITFTISGNAGVPGATLSYTDGTLKTATADGTGNYTLTVSYNWSGTVTPSKSGYTFSPVNKPYTNVLANQTAQNYTALVSISGNAGVPGATLSYTDGTPKTATADGSGNYTFTVVYNWTGTVTPSLAGYTFSPINKAYTSITANQTAQNYTALVTISGNAGIAGARLDYAGVLATGFVTADGTGNYTFTVPYSWTGTVTPSLAGYTFSPASTPYTNILVNQTAQNYTALVSISGNAGVASAKLDYAGALATGFVTADGTGNYSLNVPYNWTGTVTPSLTGFSFSPPSMTYTNVLANQTAQNYTATAITYTISGNAGIGGATLSYTDGTPKTATANGSGAYSFTVSYSWSGTVTPSKASYIFSPVSKAYTNVLANQSSQNYTATLVYSISGNVGAGGVTLSYIDGSSKTATSDGSGNYSFTVIHNWSGTVTPAKAGCTSFSPPSMTYTNVTANQTNQNYAATCPPPAAVLISPSGNIWTNYSPTYTWNQVSTATYYYLYVRITGGADVIQHLYSAADAGCNGATCSVSPATILGVGSYTWFIDSWNPVGYGPYSTGMNFSTTANAFTNVNVFVGGSLMGDYDVSPIQSARVNFPGVNGGPVMLKSSGAIPIIAAERDAWAANGVTTSFSQLMGLPDSQLSDTYLFPAYNDVTLNEQLRIGNVDTSPTTVTVTIGGVVRGTYDLAASESVRVNYAGLDSGPVIVQANPSVHIIAALRDAWLAGAPYNTTTSFVQMMGLPASQVSDTYLFPAYNNVTLNEQLRIGNVDTLPTTVTVTIGGVVRGTYDLAASASVRVNYAGLDSGPVIVQANPSVHIIAAERDAWAVNGVTTSFTQLMGLPAGQLSDTYEFPAYNNVTLNEQLRIGNVDTSPTTVTVTIGGTVQGTYPLAANQSARVNYAGLNSGPVVVRASPSVHIIAAERDAWAANGVTTSFVQLMGLPNSQLSDTFMFPAYNNVTLDEQLRFGAP